MGFIKEFKDFAIGLESVMILFLSGIDAFCSIDRF